jgi:hypothetical protein
MTVSLTHPQPKVVAEKIFSKGPGRTEKIHGKRLFPAVDDLDNLVQPRVVQYGEERTEDLLSHDGIIGRNPVDEGRFHITGLPVHPPAVNDGFTVPDAVSSGACTGSSAITAATRMPIPWNISLQRKTPTKKSMYAISATNISPAWTLPN